MAALVVGVGLLCYFVTRSDTEQLRSALWQAGPWVPVLAGLEAILLATDTAAFASLVAPASGISAAAWLRSTAAANVCFVFLPAGRVFGEAIRAGLASPHVGAPRAAMAGAELQAVALLADGLISALGGAVIGSTISQAHHLAGALAANAVLLGVAGAGLLLAIRSVRARSWLVGRFPALAKVVPAGSAGPVRAVRSACAWSMVGRLLRVLQCGIAIAAVGGVFGIRSAVLAHGLHMLSATVGVAIPNQLGVADGAYVLFADTLGFASSPGRALAAILALRGAQVALAAVCLAAVALIRAPATALSTESAGQ